MSKSSLSAHEDLANGLLVLLKFMLVLIVGLVNVVRDQLGLEADFAYGIVNATPRSQASTDGDFRLSLYPLVLRPHSSKSFSTQSLQAFVKPRENGESCIELRLGDDPSGEGWISLPARLLSSADNGALPGSAGTQTKATSFRVVSYSLPAEGLSRNREYCATYQVAFTNRSEDKRSAPQAYRVIYDPPNLGDQWRLGEAVVVQGRWTPLPEEIRGLALTTGLQGIEIDSSGRFRSVERFDGDQDTRTVTFQVGTRIESLDAENRSILIAGESVAIELGPDVVFRRYDSDPESFSDGAFSDLAPGDAIWIDPADQGMVRSAEGSLGAQLELTVRRNMPPRSIFIGERGQEANIVQLLFPKDAVREAMEALNGRRAWLFPLGESIVDPDGVRSDGASDIELPFRSFAWRDGRSPQGFRLMRDPRSRGAVLVIEDPRRLQDQDLSLVVRDEFTTVPIALRIRVMQRSAWERLGRELAN